MRSLRQENERLKNLYEQRVSGLLAQIENLKREREQRNMKPSQKVKELEVRGRFLWWSSVEVLLPYAISVWYAS